MHPLAARSRSHHGGPVNIVAFLSALVAPQPPQKPPSQPAPSSLVVVYHQDVALASDGHTPYAPSTLALLSYLATTILTCTPLSHLLAEKAARDRSLAPPVFGLAEEADGILVGLPGPANTPSSAHAGIVLDLEHRRRSGRGVAERYFLPYHSPAIADPLYPREIISLLADHPLFRPPPEPSAAAAAEPGADEPSSTFNLGLTERQRRERDAVVLPYYDAQRDDGGPGEGGRILYDMGAEDDFDEEEDEI